MILYYGWIVPLYISLPQKGELEGTNVYPKKSKDILCSWLGNVGIEKIKCFLNLYIDLI